MQLFLFFAYNIKHEFYKIELIKIKSFLFLKKKSKPAKRKTKENNVF